MNGLGWSVDSQGVEKMERSMRRELQEPESRAPCTQPHVPLMPAWCKPCRWAWGGGGEVGHLTGY